MYTASLVSSPTIPLTDAATSADGALVWQFGGDASKFSNVRFAAQTTTDSPHTNSLSFDVQETVAPGDYSIQVSVVSSASGLSSGATVVVLRVLNPATYEGEVDSAGLYAEDNNRHITVPDGSNYYTDDDGTVPDFPFVASATASLSKGKAPLVFDSTFNPLAPPRYVVATLQKVDAEHRYGCNAFLVETNTAGDSTSGTAQGSTRAIGYCHAFTFPSAFITQVGVNLNRPDQSEDIQLSSVCSSIGTYGTFTVCQAGPFLVTPVLKHAEETTFHLRLTYAVITQVKHTYDGMRYYINNKGVFYPKIPIARDWAIEAVWYEGGGYVLFPPAALYYCPSNSPSPKCHYGDRDKLRQALLRVLPQPPIGFEAHHIQPVEWCGDNSVLNGVFLPQTVADDNLAYFPEKQHGKLSLWWRTSDFKPDDPTPNCQ
jgi:hypothetical protein